MKSKILNFKINQLGFVIFWYLEIISVVKLECLVTKMVNNIKLNIKSAGLNHR